MTNEIRYFSTFTGVGGFELGIHSVPKSMGECRNARFKCIGFSEIDKYANKLLADKFPGVRNYGDITKINPDELPDFDMFCGGFPCQAFSIAGKRRGFEDTRGTMFFEVARILKAKRPKFVFLENVKGLLNHNEGETFSVIIQTLEELGYRTQWMVLNSKFFGVPQNRERVFIIGSLRGLPRPEILPFRANDSKTYGKDEQFISSQTCGTIRSGYFKQGNSDTYVKVSGEPMINALVGGGSQQSRLYDSNGIGPTLAGASKLSGDCTPRIAIPVLTPDRLEKRQNGRRFKEDGDESFTITKTDIHGVAVLSHSPRTNDPSKGGSGPLLSDEHSFTLDSTPHNVIMGMKIRRLTPLECERLQGFPDNWTAGFSDTQRYKMMGNAVTVNVIREIIKRWFNGSNTSESKTNNST